MTLALGTRAVPLEVELNEGKDFICTLVSEDGDWPAATITLTFADTEATAWTATIDGTDATWNVDKAEVDALIGRLDTSAKRKVRLSYTEGSVDLPWAQGAVTVTRWPS